MGPKCGDYGTCEMVNWNQNEVQCRCKPGYRPVDQTSMKCQIGKFFKVLMMHHLRNMIVTVK